MRPLAIRAMGELGIDIGGQTSKAVTAFEGQEFDYAVTVCDDARKACPYFARAKRQLHWAFDDPAAATGTEEDQLQVFRRVRDEIGTRIRTELLSPG